VGRLGSEPCVVSRLGLGVWVSTSFQMFALTAGGDVLGVEGNCPGRGNMSEVGNVPRWEMSYTHGPASLFVSVDLCVKSLNIFVNFFHDFYAYRIAHSQFPACVLEMCIGMGWDWDSHGNGSDNDYIIMDGNESRNRSMGIEVREWE